MIISLKRSHHQSEIIMKLYLGLFLASSLITLILFLPFSLHLSDAVPNVIDPLFYAWNFTHNTKSILQSGKNLLDTNIFYPQTNTLAYSDTLFSQMPIALPIILITKNPILAENISVFITFPIAAVCMYALLFYLTKNTPVSVLSAIFYAFSYPRLSQIGHIPAISSQWLPLVILFLLKFLSKGQMKDLTITFLFYLLSITSSIYFGVFALIPMFILTIYYGTIWITKHQHKNIIDRIKKFILLFVPFIITLILVLYPYIRLKAEYPEIKRRVEDIQYFQAHLIDYVTVLPTSNLSRLGFSTKIDEHVLYPTATLLILSMFGLYISLKRKNPVPLLFFVVGIISFILSLGTERTILIDSTSYTVRLPYYYLYHIFPLFQIVRVPARLSIFVILSLCILSAYGLDAIKKKSRKTLIYTFFLMLFIFEIWQWNTPYVRIQTGKTIPAVYQWLTHETENVSIVELPLKPLIVSASMEEQLMLPYENLSENDVYALETYRTYFSGYHGKQMINGYSGFFPQVYHDNAQAMESFPSETAIQTLKNLRIKYIIIHAKQYQKRPWEDIYREIQEYPELHQINQFGPDYVFELIEEI